jgi:uncharacterized protein YjiS (DUF1127 family)
MLTEPGSSLSGPLAAEGGFRPVLRMLACALRGALARHRMRAVLRDLAEREDYLLADIGISREWLDRAMAASAGPRGPQFRSIPEVPPKSAAMSPGPSGSAIRTACHATMTPTACTEQGVD